MQPPATRPAIRAAIRPVPAFTPYLVVSVVQVVAIAVGADALVDATKPLLMPALALALVLASWPASAASATSAGSAGSPGRAPRRGHLPYLSRPPALLFVAIALSWLGDLALMVPGNLWFVLGLGSFLLAHVAYLVLFLRIAGVGRPRAWAIVYLVWFIVFLAVLIPNLGSLVVPVVLYGLVLGAMATAATRVSTVVAVGAAVFVVSDTLLAVSKFLPAVTIPAHDVLTMTTYCLAQGIIAWGVLSRAPRPARDQPS